MKDNKNGSRSTQLRESKMKSDDEYFEPKTFRGYWLALYVEMEK